MNKTLNEKKLIIEDAIINWRVGYELFEDYAQNVEKIIGKKNVSSMDIQNWMRDNDVCKYAWEMESLTILLEIGSFKNIHDLKVYYPAI